AMRSAWWSRTGRASWPPGRGGADGPRPARCAGSARGGSGGGIVAGTLGRQDLAREVRRVLAGLVDAREPDRRDAVELAEPLEDELADRGRLDLAPPGGELVLHLGRERLDVGVVDGTPLAGGADPALDLGAL